MRLYAILSQVIHFKKLRPHYCLSKLKQNYNKMDHYKKIRKWKAVKEEETEIIDLTDSFIFKFLCYNILAQDLLDDHMYLYKNHDVDALNWETRKQLLIQEILQSGAHIICLQEVQKDHLEELLVSFESNGFSWLYKKRTHEKIDGLLLLYKKDLFNLLDSSKIEFYQSGIGLLDRDNVGLVAKFSLKQNPETKFIISTTHLLYNPRRSDIRLAQIQLLLAEIERLAYVKSTSRGPQYLPIILSGDLNLQPYSPVYNFIIGGSIEFEGRDKSLKPCDYNHLSNCLIPPHLYVTDNCQHFDVLLKRLNGLANGKVMLEQTEYEISRSEDDHSSGQGLVNHNTRACQTIEVVKDHYVTFSSGYLIHPFPFRSVYSHVNKKEQKEATTHHDSWITTDYIFYSKMTLLEKFKLPTVENCVKYFPTIPNSAVGSDHFCLGAKFLLRQT